jgi:hypothetical protein
MFKILIDSVRRCRRCTAEKKFVDVDSGAKLPDSSMAIIIGVLSPL